ncbi:MAG: DNA-processing protein DprA [Clostridia bacterium]|nr:DNA-processing protein DprA [Clostridia bacterium]
MNESEAMAVLVDARGVSYGRREAALAQAGSARAVLEDPAAYGAQLGQEGVDAVRRSMEGAQALFDRLRKDGVHLIVRGSERYPELLAQIVHPPHLLYVKGSANLCDRFPMAVVGTRRASGYGLRQTRAIARELAGEGMCIVSGLALGIDAAAHEGALDAQGRTIAVLGSSLDKMYPSANRHLMARIIDMGGSVVSEYPPGTEPTRYSFLDRNRIIAGLSLGVLVTDAPARSGALSTAQRALNEGREVFAVPGDIDRVTSQLPNRLIAEGAYAVTCADDILRKIVIEPAGMQGSGGRKKKAAAARTGKSGAQTQTGGAQTDRQMEQTLSPQERAVYDALTAGETDFDSLCEKTGMDATELGSLLLMMELDGLLEALPGCMYRLA